MQKKLETFSKFIQYEPFIPDIFHWDFPSKQIQNLRVHFLLQCLITFGNEYIIIMNTIKVIKANLHQIKLLANCQSITANSYRIINTNILTLAYPFSQSIKAKSNNDQPTADKVEEQEILTKQEVLKTYLQIIPPHRLQALLQPEKTNLSQFTAKSQQIALTTEQMQELYKKIKKNVHMIPIEALTQVLQVISVQGKQNQNQQCKALSRKIYTKILNTTRRKLNVLTLQQIVNFMYKLVKLNHKEFQFMKEVEKIIIEEKIKINYPLIRKILWSFTHLDVGSAVLYSHVAKTLKIGQHQFSPLELAEAAYMLSKTSENAAGGYGIFLIAEKHLLGHFPRLSFHDLVKATSFMLTQNLGTNQFQMELQAQLYKKYPNRPQLKINDLVTLLKSTSAYYFKFKDKALLNLLQSSTNKLAPEANLQQFQDIVWSWGRAGKGDRELWRVLEQQINRKYINLLKPRQLAFFYFSLCSTEYSSSQTIKNLQNKFIETVNSNPNINEHYLLKFLLGMQKRKDFSESSFANVSKLISDRLPKLSIKELVTFAKIINESDLCYENKENFKEMQMLLDIACESAIAQKIYMFRINQIVQILYMWIKLDISDQFYKKCSFDSEKKSNKFIETLFDQIKNEINEVPKSSFIKALFCFTIKDRYESAVQMVTIMQQLLKFGNITYFFSPYQLPLASYCVYHMIVNSNGKIQFNEQLIQQLGRALEEMNPVILNKFVRNGFEQCMKLRQIYQENRPSDTGSENKRKRKRK